MSSVPTAPDRPEQADSAEQAWFDLEAEMLIAEVEDFLATAALLRRPAQTTSAPAAGARGPGPTHTISGGTRWSPRPAPTTTTFPTQRAPPRREHPTVSNIHTRKGGEAHARHPDHQLTHTGPAQRSCPGRVHRCAGRSQSTTRSSRTRCTRCQHRPPRVGPPFSGRMPARSHRGQIQLTENELDDQFDNPFGPDSHQRVRLGPRATARTAQRWPHPPSGSTLPANYLTSCWGVPQPDGS